ncbi:MAG TPA: hypothetical protein VEG32_05345 [Clostridia bacterium]|nr:hypothetical protein [Clostridia bacterium]
MKTTVLLFLLLLASTAGAQQPTAPAPPAQVAQPPLQGQPPNDAYNADIAALNNLLTSLQRVSSSAAVNLARLRVDKWKADKDIKRQAQNTIDSIQRNLTGAIPDLIARVQAAPQDLSPNFKLYRNLNVVFDVLAPVAESAGAFGPRDQYEPLAEDVGALDQVRRSLADRLDWLAGMRDGELASLRQTVRAAQLARQQAPPKKVVVDDTKPAKPRARKPKAAAPKPPQ